MKKILFWLALMPFAQLFAGTITTSVTSLYNFKSCYVDHSATAQWFTVSGTSLSANVVITAPDHFEVSTDLNKFYSGTLTINASGTLSSTKIFVRFSPFSIGSKSGNVEVASTGSATKNISVSGTGASFTSLSSYYPVTNNTGASLKTSLYTAVNSGVKSFGYGTLYSHYPSTDTYYDGTVWDVYSTKVDAPSPFTFNHGSKQCGNYTNEGDCYNREHTMPQSWFKEASPMVSDIHHILPTDGKVNGMRSNYPFGEVSNPTYTSKQGGKVGSNTTSGYSGTVFEPIDEYKGDIARGLLFMAVRYEDKIANWSGNGNAGTALAGNSFPAYDPWFIDLLIKWHNQDPPSNREIIRNNYIATSGCQNNRNPFIDSPQYVQKIWGGNMPSEATTIATALSVTNNTGTSFTLNFKSGDGFRRLIVVRPASASAVHPTDFIHYNANANITSASTTGSQNYVVYNGTSSTADITGLTQGTSYTVNVYEYNGWMSTANYRTSTFASVSTAPASVEWGTLTATKQNNKSIDLSWTTLKENNNSVFDIERSLNGGAYLVIGSKNTLGNSTSTQSYSFTDDTLKNASVNNIISLVYRIKQTGTANDFSYSNTAVVTNSVPLPDTVIWTNFTATLQGDNKSVQLNWSTSKELNNLGFEIEKGSNGQAYVFYKTIATKGNSNSTQTYTLTDTSNAGLTSANYRIKYVCSNGTNAYFGSTRTINFTPSIVPDTVIWMSFTAALQSDSKTVQLSWSTSKEFNNLRFEVEKGSSNQSLSLLRNIASKGNSNGTQTYTLNDTANTGLLNAYYKIRYVCANGTNAYFNGTQSITFPAPVIQRKDSVSISGFDAEMDLTKNIKVSWTVNYEGKNGSFDLLRSINNKPYYVVWTHAGAPHNAATTSVFNDDTLKKNPAIEKIVYMMRYTGENQTYVFSTDTQMVVNDPSTGLFETYNFFNGKVFPQPFNDRLNISLPAPENGVFNFSFTDLLGRRVLSRSENALNGNVLISNLEGLTKGVYILTINHESETWHVRIIKN